MLYIQIDIQVLYVIQVADRRTIKGSISGRRHKVMSGEKGSGVHHNRLLPQFYFALSFGHFILKMLNSYVTSCHRVEKMEKSNISENIPPKFSTAMDAFRLSPSPSPSPSPALDDVHTLVKGHTSAYEVS